MGKKINMTGWKMWEHGVPDSRLTVIKESGKSGSGGVFWDCICNCGNTIQASSSNIRLGVTKSCGCKNRDNAIQRNMNHNTVQIGQKYNKLTVIQDLGLRYPTENSKKRRRYFLCECECGNVIEVMGNSLQTGHISSCGCLRSKGENKIKKILEENNIKFEIDKSFPLMKKDLKRNLRFDFIIYNDDNTVNRFIEFDGKQHKFGMQGGHWSQAEPLEKIQERDKIKNEWCLKNNYILVRIPYTRLKKLCLEDLMSDKFIYKGDDS